MEPSNLPPVTIQSYQDLALRTEAPITGVLPNLLGAPKACKPDEKYASSELAELGNGAQLFATHPAAMANVRLIHASLGLVSDIDELSHATDCINMIEELGDITWFIANGAAGLGTTFERLHKCNGGWDKTDPELEENPIDISCTQGVVEGEYRKHVKAMQQMAANFSDIVKKRVFYGATKLKNPERPLDEDLRVILVKMIYGVRRYISVYNTYELFPKQITGVTLESVLQANIDKLRARYPDLFTEEAAQNRDTDAERSAIGEQVRSQNTPDAAPAGEGCEKAEPPTDIFGLEKATDDRAALGKILEPFVGRPVDSATVTEVEAALEGMGSKLVPIYSEEGSNAVFAPMEPTEEEKAVQQDMVAGFQFLSERKQLSESDVTPAQRVLDCNALLEAEGFKVRVAVMNLAVSLDSAKQVLGAVTSGPKRSYIRLGRDIGSTEAAREAYEGMSAQEVCFGILLDMLGQYEREAGKTPTHVHIPLAVEGLLNEYVKEYRGIKEPLRETGKMLGCQIVFDAAHLFYSNEESDKHCDCENCGLRKELGMLLEPFIGKTITPEIMQDVQTVLIAFAKTGDAAMALASITQMEAKPEEPQAPVEPPCSQ